jgi:hypothetical protein
MNRSFRHLALAGLAAVLVLALTESAAQAQFRRYGFPAAPVTTANYYYANRTFPSVPILGTPGVGVNTNPWISPYQTLNQAAYNTAVMGNALSTIPPYWLGYNPYIRNVNYSPVYAGYNPYLYGYNPYAYNPYLYYGY